jgi:hypothetical protein
MDPSWIHHVNRDLSDSGSSVISEIGSSATEINQRLNCKDAVPEDAVDFLPFRIRPLWRHQLNLALRVYMELCDVGKQTVSMYL